jgi:hypothetical protein
LPGKTGKTGKTEDSEYDVGIFVTGSNSKMMNIRDFLLEHNT